MSQPNRQLNLNDGNRESFKNKIKQHEDNIKFLNSLSNRFAESILDLQENGNGAFHTEEETVEQILKKENSAAGIFCWLKANAQISNLAFAKDAVGIVATLARVENDDLSRILSEYLGLETMLAIVCSTYEGVNALEKYNTEGMINCNDGLHGIGSSIGRRINGRFIVICLEDLRPFVGGFIPNDPQKKLALPKPKLPNGECPPGFIDYAVNMIHLDSNNFSFLTASGHGLRETLFYGLFSRLQLYKTRNDMLLSLPCINDGALSLDGGMIRKCGMFALGSRKVVEVKFPLISGESDVPPNYIEAEDMVRKLKWESSKLAADIHREQQLLDYRKGNFTSQP
ncbi:protein DEFECTIVE IN MERISTEM SILENCING 3-like isoform X2 [Gastrolobium bilobum]|uniref:protein DEFECTIVE IN MERISTEM SILENCING 3-like isoform X2 n=1 Tax=Gastrolobium bilobum TaxID=150636 RepID=UPI002AB3021B|nr:protein DEFECTIVE IN MERISTEM SILENCING 3-like isoform X2 [Gastrolobium bilobum]